METLRVDQLGTGTVYTLGCHLPPLPYMLGSQKFVDVRFARWLFENDLEAWILPRKKKRFPSLLREAGIDASDTIARQFTRNWPVEVTKEVAVYAGVAARGEILTEAER